ncbi:unnamed protein product [Clonostachys byssicola]|uniref:DUF1763-domain-containing protein n=1 Tax=Clonostachys byssicola TaxID=160290 RepID=A0A9N9XWN7_9HYPO|nr:unnamed protein product [Clonostachys byssicola]
MANLDVVHAYRHLYRGLLQAIQFSKPARYVVRAQMRQAFREEGAALDKEAVKRTVWFMQAAARERGIEHQIVKNLIGVRVRNHIGRETWRSTYVREIQGTPFEEQRKKAFDHYNMTIAMLNKTMGLCLR